VTIKGLHASVRNVRGRTSFISGGRKERIAEHSSSRSALCVSELEF